MLAGFLLIVVAQAQMGASWRIGIDDAKLPLVTWGLFAWVRNPIYSGMIATVIGVALAAPSLLTIALAVTGAVAMLVQARLEERHLLSVFGEAYREYGKSVGRFVPGVGKLS